VKHAQNSSNLSRPNSYSPPTSEFDIEHTENSELIRAIPELTEPLGSCALHPSARGCHEQTRTTNSVSVHLNSSVATDANRDFVPLPTDAQRSAAMGYRRAFANARPLKQSIGDAAATLLSALCALLFRYTQQGTIALQLYAPEPKLALRRSSLMRCLVTASEPVIKASAQATSAIFSLREAAYEANGSARSNIAVSFVGAGHERAEVLADSDAHDVHFVVRSEPPELELAYNACLFEPSTIERLADALVRVFEVALECPVTTIACLPVLSAADLHAMTVEWDSGHAEYPDEPVHRVFEHLARERPEALAASFDGQTVTYGELDAQSNRLAQHLIACGVTPGSAIAVCVLPSLDIVVAFLAIWKSGAVYVPLDPTHPEALIAVILDEVQPKVVLTQSKLRQLTRPECHAQFCFDTDLHLIMARRAIAPDVNVALIDPAYVLYTSGTTGMPKGVAARHANLAHYIHVAQQKYNFGRDDVFCSLARYTFSISLFELVLPLCCGASVKLLARDDVLSPSRLASTLGQVTVVHAGPSLLGNLFRYLRSAASSTQTFPRMRHASSGGDIVPPTLIEEMKQVFENAELYIIYGCTEISCMGCTFPVIRGQKVTRTLVGKPFPDVVIHIIDPAGNFAPFGAVGEICFAGNGVVCGYLDRQDLTVEKFVEREHRLFYRTGDMGRLHSDGNVEILGRRDYQVQLRGIRVELVGIENVVRDIGLAEQCVMVVKNLSEHDVRLVAFVVKPRESNIAAFRHALAKHLPDYMLPQSLVVVDALPITLNGKLDRSAVQELLWETSKSEAPRSAPVTTIERQVAAAFAMTLGVTEMGIDDDFFDRGGHSLLAVIMMQELENALGLSLPLGLLFEYTTVRTLAEQVRGSMSHVPRPVPLSAARDNPSLYMLLGVQLYSAFAKRFEGQYSVYGVYAGRELVMLESSDKTPTVPELASDYVEIIRRHQPKGPYRIAGISFGGIVAYEVAQQLCASGAEVAYVGLIDAMLPESGVRHSFRQLGRLLRLPSRKIVRVATRHFRAIVAAMLGSRPRSEFTRYDLHEKLAPIEDVRQEAYARAAENYIGQIRPLRGNVELVVAGRRLARDPLQSPDCGWHSHDSSVRIHTLDSDHLNLLEEPHVASVAELFLKSLHHAEMQARS
jgi:amino acid adenylation domain-containing protein